MWSISISHFPPLKSHHRNNQMLQFICVDGCDNEEFIEELIEVESMPIYVSDINGDEDVTRVVFIGV